MLSEPECKRFRVILARPSESGNIGAACRAMKNFGLSSLRIVAPERPINEDRVRVMAVHAYDIYSNAEFFPDLKSALNDVTFAVALTRRRGKRRKSRFLPISEYAKQAWEMAAGQALVFGNERTGLTDAECALCNLAAYIPSSPEFPSLNLAAAIQVCAWELYRNRPQVLPESWEVAGVGACEKAANQVVEWMEQSGCFRTKRQVEVRDFLRDLSCRAGLSQKELALFTELFRKWRGLWLKSSEMEKLDPS